jgi:hypothetical protein
MRSKTLIDMLRTMLLERDARIAELEDRLMANSLSELRAFRPVAMTMPTDLPEYDVFTDTTGLVTERVPRAE